MSIAIAFLKASPVTALFIGIEDLDETTILIRDAAKPQTWPGLFLKLSSHSFRDRVDMGLGFCEKEGGVVRPHQQSSGIHEYI